MKSRIAGPRLEWAMFFLALLMIPLILIQVGPSPDSIFHRDPGAGLGWRRRTFSDESACDVALRIAHEQEIGLGRLVGYARRAVVVVEGALVRVELSRRYCLQDRVSLDLLQPHHPSVDGCNFATDGAFRNALSSRIAMDLSLSSKSPLREVSDLGLRLLA
jgi:hypothetical protein